MKRMLLLIIILPLIGQATAQVEPGMPLTQAQLDAIKANNEAMGLIAADSGLQIVSANKAPALYEQQNIREKFHHDLREMKQHGFVKENSADAQYLLAIKDPDNMVRKDLKTNVTDVKLAFPYSGLTFIPNENMMGYAGFIGWDNGWLGITQFFSTKTFEVCNYERHNMKLSHGGVRLIKEDLEYDVNRKPTHYIARGDDTSGYVYYTSWYDTTYIHNLQCATEHFKPDGMQQLIRLAIKIDQVH